MTIKNAKDMIEGYADRMLLNERHDCTVVSMAASLGMSYKAAHDLAKSHGRRPRQGMDPDRFRELMVTLIQRGKLNWLPIERIRTYYKSTDRYRKMKLSTFCKNNSKGTYILLVRGHVTTVKDGIVVDGVGQPNQYVKQGWMVMGV